MFKNFSSLDHRSIFLVYYYRPYFRKKKKKKKKKKHFFRPPFQRFTPDIPIENKTKQKQNPLRHGSQIWPQISAASPRNRPQPKVIITIELIKLTLWPAAGCEAKVAAELSSRP